MTHTLAKNVLRELLADVIREHRGDAPGDLADSLLATLKIYAPKSYIEERVDLDSPQDEKLMKIAEEMIKSHAFDISPWEIQAAYGRLSEDEVQSVDDLIGLASISIQF